MAQVIMNIELGTIRYYCDCSNILPYSCHSETYFLKGIGKNFIVSGFLITQKEFFLLFHP